MFLSKTWDFTSYHPGKTASLFFKHLRELRGQQQKSPKRTTCFTWSHFDPEQPNFREKPKAMFFFQEFFFFGGLVWFQEISNRTHWTDPSTWVSNSSSNSLRGPLVRSHSIFDGLVHLFFFWNAVFWEHNSEETHSRHSLTATLGLPCDAESLGISSTSDVMSRWRWRRMTADDLQKANNEDRDPSDMNERGGNETLGGGSKIGVPPNHPF